MAKMPRMTAGLTDYTFADLEALEDERPELGRLEVIDGALHATGESAVGNLHQLLLQRLHLLFAAACPPTSIVRLDTWWYPPEGKIRPDVAVYRPADRPADPHGVFSVPPAAIVEILSDDAHHDLVRKDEIYARHGVRRGYLDMRRRFDWWLRLDGVDHDGAVVTWQLDGWPPLTFDREALFDLDG
jgi:Uma2 family endonuclease